MTATVARVRRPPPRRPSRAVSTRRAALVRASTCSSVPTARWPASTAGPRLGRVRARYLKRLPQQRPSRVVDPQHRPRRAARLAVPPEQHLVAEQERRALGERHPDDRRVPRPGRHHDRLRQVLKPRPGPDVDRHPQHRLEPVRPGQRDRRRRRPHPQERPRADRDPQAQARPRRSARPPRRPRKRPQASAAAPAAPATPAPAAGSRPPGPATATISAAAADPVPRQPAAPRRCGPRSCTRHVPPSRARPPGGRASSRARRSERSGITRPLALVEGR